MRICIVCRSIVAADSALTLSHRGRSNLYTRDIDRLRRSRADYTYLTIPTQGLRKNGGLTLRCDAHDLHEPIANQKLDVANKNLVISTQKKVFK